MQTCYEDYLVCDACCNDNYVYSEYRDTYISYEDADEEDREPDYEDDYVYQYDYDVMQDLSLTSLPDERIELNTAYYGVELEVERRKACPSNIAERVHNLFHKYVPFALLKTDGSLWIWGINYMGMLGLNQPDTIKLSSPTQIPGTWSNVRDGIYGFTADTVI